VPLFNGGFPPPGIPAGTDGITLPKQPATIYKRGEIVEMAWALTANHGGGYSYRLCKIPPDGNVTEECFQKIPLKFVGDHHRFQYAGRWFPGKEPPSYDVPMTKVSEGTFPPGSEWARVPMPACRYYDQSICGPEVPINYTSPGGEIPWGGTFYGGDAWIAQVDCASIGAGATIEPDGPPPPTDINNSYGLSDGQLCPPGKTQFTEVVPGISGFLANHTYPVRSVIAFSIVDKIQIPADIEEGNYMLSWRWDCEQTYQIWQNCADIVIQGSVPVAAAPTTDWKLFFIVGMVVLGAISILATGLAIHQCQQRKGDYQTMRDPLRRSSVQ